MKRFRFTLQALLTVRQRQEQTALESYAAALADRQRALDRLRDAQRQCEEAWGLSRQRITAGAPAAHLAQLEEFCEAVEDLRRFCLAAVEETQRVVDARLQKLLAARQAREAVDKFREHQRERYDRELTRAEQKTLDELAQHRAPLAALQLLNSEGRWN